MIKCYKNGNIHCKRTADTYYMETESPVVNLLQELYDCCNMARLGDAMCIGNSEMAIYMYSYENDKKYMLLYSDVEKWAQGYSIILYPHDLEEYDREYFDEDGFLS